MAEARVEVSVREHQGVGHPSSFDAIHDFYDNYKSPSPEASPEVEDPTVSESPSISGGFRPEDSAYYGWSEAQINAAMAERSRWQLAEQKESHETSRRLAEERSGPEPGATYDDTRVYTGSRSLGWKYWGVRPPDVDIEDYWVIRDPERTRELAETYRKVSAPASTPAATPPPVTGKPGRPRKSPKSKVDHKGKKPVNQSSKVKKTARKSLTSTSDAAIGELDGSGGETIASGSKSNRRSQGQPLINESPPEADPTAMMDNASASILSKARESAKPGRKSGLTIFLAHESRNDLAGIRNPASTAKTKKRGRPPKTRLRETSKQRQRLPVHGRAKVTKSKAKEEQPSTHAMRTRARGPAESHTHL